MAKGDPTLVDGRWHPGGPRGDEIPADPSGTCLDNFSKCAEMASQNRFSAVG